MIQKELAKPQYQIPNINFRNGNKKFGGPSSCYWKWCLAKYFLRFHNWKIVSSIALTSLFFLPLLFSLPNFHLILVFIHIMTHVMSLYILLCHYTLYFTCSVPQSSSLCLSLQYTVSVWSHFCSVPSPRTLVFCTISYTVLFIVLFLQTN